VVSSDVSTREPGARPPAGARRWSQWAEPLAISIIALAFLLALRALLHNAGPPMEEGFMLAFPERFLEGDIPNKDFLHLYGPGSIWVLAGWYKVFGVTLLSERMFGLLQEVGIAYGVYFLARRWGRTTGVIAALISVIFIIEPHGLTALAWPGAVALGLFGLVAAAASREAGDDRRSRRFAVLAGVLAGFAVLFRIDIVAAVAFGSVAIGWGAGRVGYKRFAAGLGIGLFPFVIHGAMAGPGNAFRGMVIDPIFNLRGGRNLPIPPPWGHFDSEVQNVAEFVRISWPIPNLEAPAQLSLWWFLLLGSTAANVIIGVRAVRRDRVSLRPRVFLGSACFAAGLVFQAFQRADNTHIAWAACVTMALLPVGIVEIVKAKRPDLGLRRIGLIVGVSFIAALTLLIPNYTTRAYTELAVQTVGIHTKFRGNKIENRGRIFYYGRKDYARAANKALKKVEEIAEPGDRLISAPLNLRVIPLNESFFYYLLPQLEPGTYYIEMDPGVSNARDSGLADEIRKADVLVLTTAWAYFSEPNASTNFIGPKEPNDVVRKQFCLIERYGPYRVFQKCEK
jgi:4-amino-4-deoxy-L-arabinose transferase-like glycosyltransferase